MPNGINSVSPDLRDWLLNKNLILSDTVQDNGLAGLAIGLGKPANIDTQPNTVQASTDIVTNGVFYRDLNLIYNPYKSINGNELIDINRNTLTNIGNLIPGPIPVEYQQNVGSDNENSIFNSEANLAREQMLKNKFFDSEFLYKVDINTNIISPISDGVYQFRNSIINRSIDSLLGSNNFIGASQELGVLANDSEIGLIGNQQLIKHFGYNTGAGLLQGTLGHINANPLSLLQGNDIIVPNYSITIDKGSLGGVGDFASRVFGFELPVSLMAQSSSIFASENPVDNIRRAQSMVLNTGKGQVLAMITNLNANKYKPTIVDGRKRENITKGDTGTNGELYAFESNEPGQIIDLLNTTPVSASDSNTLNSDEIGFEETHGKITSELLGGFNDDFDNLTNRSTSFSDIDDRGNVEWDTTKFTWTDDNNKKGEELGIFTRSDMKNPKSLLFKTQSLFKTNKTRNLITAKGHLQNSPSEIENSVNVGSSSFISKGSGVKSLSAIEGTAVNPEDIFCRVWTTFDRYNKVNDLQKNDGINNNVGSRVKNRSESSILDSTSNGFAKVAPYKSQPDVKKFMLSLENLAWDGITQQLPDCEIGNGDPVTGTKGRLMWFPPYDLQFTDTTSVNWDSTNFIGRGEPVYTYNNTERTGTLGFKVIVDYASYMDDLRGIDADNDIFDSIAAGCIDFENEIVTQLSKTERDKIDVNNVQKTQLIQGEVTGYEPAPFKMYFPNDSVTIPKTYEDGTVNITDYTYSDGYTFKGCNGGPGVSNAGCNCLQKNRTDFGLNSSSLSLPSDSEITDFPNGWINTNYVDELANYIVNKAPSVRIYIDGTASSDGTTTANMTLSQVRANNVKTILQTALLNAGDTLGGKRFGQQPVGKGVVNATSCPAKTIKTCEPQAGIPDVDHECKKKSRVVMITFKKDPTLQPQINDAVKTIVKDDNNTTLSRDIKSRFVDECKYFEKMEEDSPFIYDRISEKIAQFHPAFHSTTPEGFNSRLNFLMQCTRQGPTPNSTNDPSNLAFGKAPVCILRLGDFYNTKIIIDNVDLSFDPLVWDLNPEGIGVQPMIANVMLSFKFIGGSSLSGPINRLQNAISYNYFANTEIYDDKSDTVKKGEFVNGSLPKNLEMLDEAENDGLNTNNSVPETNQLNEAEKANSIEEENSSNNEILGDKGIGFDTYRLFDTTTVNNGIVNNQITATFSISTSEKINNEHKIYIELIDTNTNVVFGNSVEFLLTDKIKNGMVSWDIPRNNDMTNLDNRFSLKGKTKEGYPFIIVN